MPIDFDRVATKLQAIQNKNVDDIVSNHVYILYMGPAQSTDEVDTYLQKRVVVLQTIQTFTSDSQVELSIAPLYNSLCDSCKAIVEDVESVDVPCEADYDKVCAIWLFNFGLGLT